jgi:cyclic pyranopterin phosphate synthase
MATDALKRPLRDLRISIIDNCNFRCPYCMPAEIFGENYVFLRKDQLLSFDEIERLARIFVGLGVKKIKITGGEPLLRPWVHELISRLVQIPGLSDVGMITNGYHLGKLAPYLKEAGLSRVSISLDSLDPDRFRELNGRGKQLDVVMDGIESAERNGFSPIKLNMVVQRGINDDEVLDFVEFARRKPYVPRFIEYMDVGNRNRWERTMVVPSKELLGRIRERYTVEPLDEQYHGEVADRYSINGGEGEIGFISSVSQPFCQDCTRARISADGSLYTCLFAQHGTDLRELVRSGESDESIAQRIKDVWEHRTDRYSERRAEERQKDQQKVEMYYIGG